MEFEIVLNGIIKFLNKEILSQMNSWQEIMARVAMARAINNAEEIKKMLTRNPFLKTFAIADENAIIDVEGLVNDIKTAIRDKECIEFDLPLFGKFKFVESDIDLLYSYIRGSI
jgi:hypothetical protein